MISDPLTFPNRVRYQVSSASPLNWVSEAQKLIELIKQYNID
jgi:hypothetical protein